MNRRIALGFLVAMTLIAMGFALSFYSYNQYRKDRELIEHTQQVIGQLEDILSAMKDVETGARGYMISNDTLFLEPYRQALPKLPTMVDRLQQLVSDNPIQRKRADSLAKLIDDKLEISARQILETSQQTTALQTTYLRIGKIRMDRIRAFTARMTEYERIRISERYQQADRSYRNTTLLIFMLSVLTFLALAASYRLLEQELARRQRTEDQLRSYEAQLKEQIRQLEASNEELERFAFVASHDLQEPLRKIQSFSDLIMDRYANLFDGDSRLFMSKISGSAERMSKLIKDLLNFSRISTHRESAKPVRLDEVIQRILDDQELRIKARRIDVQVEPLPMIQAVPSQIDHLFANLISNAIKFMKADGQPRLQIRATAVDGSQYAQAGLTPGRRYFEISVEDNGIGFDEKYIEHIFKVFQRLHGKSEYEGTGIGLAICKRVVVYHQGYITARSTPKQGTTFVVVLPESQSILDYDRTITGEVHSYIAG
ncbi:histidine kinase [Spirosoma montaniterrae]|uniref:histidine kinase n=2 Tax=Spirosoma montaniterrae TaxID=1178516 RepID=A0A1P9X476_9BACT|nr:histidine kinase [Spirosoma montaniterrae]